MALDRFIAGIEQTAVVVVVDAFATPTLFTLLLATGTTPFDAFLAVVAVLA